MLGSPVDLSFDVQPDPGSDLASSCVAARVMAGDTVVSDAKVQVVPLPDLRGRPPAVRVHAAIAVDEPVVTVTLSAGCAGKVTRTYTFLSEFPAAVARTASPVDVARLPSVAGQGADLPRVQQGAAPARADAPRAPAAAAPAPASPEPASPPQRSPAPVAPKARPASPVADAPVPARPSPAQRPAPAARLAKKAAPEPRPAEKPPNRLVVEPLDLWTDRPVALRAAPELQAAPSDQPSAERAQAAALWKSLNAQPGDVPPEAERLKALEADVAALRARAARDQAQAAQLQQQLAQADTDKFPATVVYALAGLLLLAGALVAWAWLRLRRATDKAVRAWRDSVAAMGGRDALAAHEAALGLVPHPDDAWTSSAGTDGGADAGAQTVALVPPFVATAPAPSAPAPLKPAVPAPAPLPVAAVAAYVPAPGPAPVPAPQPVVHIVSPEELFDIQQQAEFFISVGEHQQAIEVLKKHIAEHGDTSPLAYLELLRLYHSLSRVEEFSQLRAQFMQSFNAQVPEFAGFHRTGRMLYHYTEALAEIEAEWSSPAVLLVLEKMLFRREAESPVERFDLAAYDDLLLLLSIAQTTPASARGAAPPRKRTTPLSAPAMVEGLQERPAVPQQVLAPEHDLPLDSLNAALEFDFDEVFPSARPAAPQSAVAPAPVDTRGAPLDLDLTEPPHLTLSDLPPVPVTAPPPPGHAVGFGLDNDLVELRLELEQKKTDSR
ncbi:hypothetical protein [Acidovorax sp.]|uniref:hypothetical protein n=1 Tax=Acidovorax sp. TaxID=1872122 RepID=UPI0034494211